MLKHLFKLIWNKKKENFLLISEILISFMVIFAVFTLLVYNYQIYKIPSGIEDESVWSVDLGGLKVSKHKDSVGLVQEGLRTMLKGESGIKSMTFASGNVPFADTYINTTVRYKDKEQVTEIFNVEDNYKDVLRVSMINGRWFDAQDNAYAVEPVILNEAAKLKLFGSTTAIGKIIDKEKKQLKIIGVVQNLKDKNDFKAAEPAIYTRIDTGNINWMNKMLIRVAPGMGAAFEGKIYKAISSQIKSTNLEIKDLSDMKAEKNKEVTVPIVIFFIVAAFLIINVALGIFGVLWYNINKRRAEIGLRRAIGATAGSVSGQLVGEALVIATFSLIIGSFFAIQFPLLDVFDLPASVYLLAQLFAILFIYLLVIICALYPGRQAASIYPAVALHEE